MIDKIFYILSALTIICATLVVVSRHPIKSVLFLVATFFLISAHYILLNAQFLALVNIVVYAGAIMVLFLFVIMFLNLNKEIEIYYPNIINLNSSQNARFNLYILGSQAVIDLLSIYDRWGNLLWQTHTIQANNQQQGWNGTANNQFVLPGVYVWHASIRLPDGSIIKKSGDLTVIR